MHGTSIRKWGTAHAPGAPTRVCLTSGVCGCHVVCHRNIVVPAQALGTPVTAVSAMLQSSPLALGALPSSGFKSLG